MGPRLSEVYVQALKNVDAARNCSADVMSRVLVVLSELVKGLTSPAETRGKEAKTPVGLGSWAWAETERQRTKQLINHKDVGDRQFRAGSHGDAIQSYTHAINVDKQAVRWAAILYNNRAAAYMALGQHASAIADCHQAISRDGDYARAYLRRARALAASKSYAAAVRDFRRYLSSEPVPNDHAAVNQEMENAMEANRKQMRGDQQRHDWEQRTEDQRRAWAGATGGNGSSSSSPRGSARPFGFAGRGANGRPATSGYPYGRASGSSSWAEDDDDPLNFRSKSGKPPSQPWFGRGPPPGGKVPRESSFMMDSDEDDDDDDDGPFASSAFPRWQQTGRGAGGGAGSGGTYRGAAGSSSQRATGGNGVGVAGDHYSTLGIDPSANERAIKSAYRKLALQFHPDKNKEAGAEDKFKAISSAYTVLSEKTSKDQYDRVRAVGGGFGRGGWGR